MNLTETNKIIKAFEEEIKRLLKAGKSPKEAVKAAYKKYPVMETLREELDAQIIAEMARGSEYAFPAEALAAAAAKPWAEDGLTLSDRTTKGSKAVVSHVAAAIGNCIKENQTTYATSRKLFDGYQKDGIIPEQDIPNFMHSLIRAAQPNMRRSPEFRRVLRNATRNVEKLTTQGVKAAYNQITEVILTGNEKRLDKAVYVATQERTRYFAERIARTELARAYHDGVTAKWGKDPDCVAYKWRMSKSHPAPDICDMYAGANLYGMGPGVFPKDKVPELPAHPHCMCYLRPLMDGSLRLESNTPVDRVAKGGKEWLDKQSQYVRQHILGEKGEAIVQTGADWRRFARNYNRAYLKSRIDGVLEFVDSEVKLPISLGFVYNGVKQFIPVNTLVQPEKVIAGLGSDQPLRIAGALAKEHGGRTEQWQKMVGTVKSERFVFDIHWYSHVGLPDIEFKIKSYKERRNRR